MYFIVLLPQYIYIFCSYILFIFSIMHTYEFIKKKRENEVTRFFKSIIIKNNE